MAGAHGLATLAASCATLTISASPSSVGYSRSGGAQVYATATLTGCTPIPRYEFWLRPATSPVWTKVQAYAANHVYVWDSTGADPGTVYIGVREKDVNATSYDVVASTSAAWWRRRALGSRLLRPRHLRNRKVLTGAATGCSNPSYEFWAKWQFSSVWHLLRGYSTSATLVWNSTGAMPGTYQIVGVWARDIGSPAAYDAVDSTTYAITGPRCIGLTVSASPPSVVSGNGTHVVITVVAQSCVNPNPLYEFWLKPAGSSSWILVRPYSTVGTYDWNSTGAAPGTETFGIWIRDSYSTAAYDIAAGTPISVT